jgi:hypothetical protein
LEIRHWEVKLSAAMHRAGCSQLRLQRSMGQTGTASATALSPSRAHLFPQIALVFICSAMYSA